MAAFEMVRLPVSGLVTQPLVSAKAPSETAEIIDLFIRIFFSLIVFLSRQHYAPPTRRFRLTQDK
jgi:hypothetical protein